ncbi:MAG: hypothetical protein AAF192_12450 [Pseudomonadota bacterium]
MTLFMRLTGACGVAFFGMISPAFAITLGANEVVNGSFEADDASQFGLVNTSQTLTAGSLAGTNGNSWDVFAALPGWTRGSGDAGIEIQTNGTLNSIDADDGNRYVELDSHDNGGSVGSNSSMSQVISGLATGTYQFSFSYSPRNNNVNDNGIDYSVTPDGPDTSIAGPSTVAPVSSVGSWTRVIHTFDLLSSDTVTVSFAATGLDNTLGGFIDDVALQRVIATPLPAAVLLFASAFGIAGAVRRFKLA